MDNTPRPLDEILDRVAVVKKEREELEGSLAGCRRESRALALELIFDYAYSLHRTSVLTGHMRPTLKVWVDVEAARRGMPAFRALPDA